MRNEGVELMNREESKTYGEKGRKRGRGIGAKEELKENRESHTKSHP